MSTHLAAPSSPETVFTYGAPQLKFGAGASSELGFDLAALGATRVLLITDAGLVSTGHPQLLAEQIRGHGIDVVLFDGVHVEPTDASLQAAVDFARGAGAVDGLVAVGGGSSIDTAKAVNLLLTNPGELMDYVNRPIGGGRAPGRRLHPLIAVPTTTGTGSESTTICVLDVLARRVKTGISHPRLRPTLAVVDSDLTATQPPAVTAASGMDVLCHALESYTARSFMSYERHAADQRVPYCGANPLSDLWAEKALTLLAGAYRRAVAEGGDGADGQARSDMALAATVAGLGFGNAGVHIPHANAYPIAGQVRTFHAPGFPGDEPFVPHGMAVGLTAAAAFRFTFAADPGRHLRAAQLLDPDDRAGARAGRPEDRLPRVLTGLMADVGLPDGLAAVGFTEADVPNFVEGASAQTRLLATAPRSVSDDDLADILTASLVNP